MKRKIVTISLILYFISCIVTSIFAAIEIVPGVRPLYAKEELKKYYALLDSIVTLSSTDQVQVLQNFVKEHPIFEKAYDKLLERYLCFNKLNEAQLFFEALTESALYRNSSLRMLGKIYYYQNQNTIAFTAFLKAIQSGNPSIQLLKDFVYLYCDSLFELSVRNEMQKILKNNSAQLLVSIFLAYKKHDYQATFDLIKKLPYDIAMTPEILHIRGDCAFRRSDYPGADSLWQYGLKMAQADGDLQAEIQFLINLGVLDKSKGNYDHAASLYQTALTKANKIDDFYLKQRIAGNWGVLMHRCEKFEQALTSYEKAITLSAKIKLYDYTTVWYSNCALIYRQLGLYNKALQYFNKSEEFAQKINDTRQVVELYLSKAELYAYLNQRDYAKKFYEEAYRLSAEHHYPNLEYHATARIADFMAEAGEYEKARTAYQNYITFLRQNNRKYEIDYWLWKIAKTYRSEASYELSRKYYLEAIDSALAVDSEFYANWYKLGLAELELDLKRNHAAIDIFSEIKSFAMTKNDPNMLSQIFTGLGDAYSNLEKIDEAILNYSKAAQIIENTRKNIGVEQLRIGYFSKNNDVYAKLVRCFLMRYEQENRATDLDSLFYYDQMARGRSLRDLRYFQLATRDRKTKEYEDYLLACDQLQKMQRELRLNTVKYNRLNLKNDLISEIEAARYSLVAQRLKLIQQDIVVKKDNTKEDNSIQAITQQLQKMNMGVLIYNINQELPFAFVLANGEGRPVRLHVDQHTISTLVDSLLQPFHHVQESTINGISFNAEIAYRLYEKLFAPIDKTEKLPPQLLIIPDLTLMGLPFEMLLTAKPEKSEFKPSDYPTYAGFFLINTYSIVYSPSTKVLHEKLQRIKNDPEVLVLANPFYYKQHDGQNSEKFRFFSDWQFEPLPYSEIEAEKIREVYRQTRVLKRNEACHFELSKSRSSRKMLHIASHAFVDTTFDEFSGLVLAIGKDSIDDGLLMGYEISDTDFKYDLVTLSACESGCGKKIAGEGVLGLPRLFLRAGTKTVLMTLWKVDDRFSSQLIPKFYDFLLNKKLSKVCSLSATKRFIIQNPELYSKPHIYYQHPFFWASFALYGDPGVESSSTFWRNMIIGVIILLTLLLIVYRLILKFNLKNNKGDIKYYK